MDMKNASKKFKDNDNKSVTDLGTIFTKQIFGTDKTINVPSLVSTIQSENRVVHLKILQKHLL